MGKKLDSPCIDICTLDKESGLCTGCLRTIHEIAGWGQFSPAQRRAVLSELPRRKAR